ncbi:MAG: hypothetical protein Q7U39_07705 [Nitrospira sp.]|nr:hypothetical protein [Nitrospira sp.]
MTHRPFARLLLAVFALSAAGCLATPQPIVISETPGQVVEVRYDAKAGNGHSHPRALTISQITSILKGVQVHDRDLVGTAGLLMGSDAVPAFTDKDVAALAPHLVAGLAKASPVDLVSFYLAQRGSNRAPLITSGGVFIRNQRLYLILANARTSPSSIQYENTYETNSLSNPLLPIARFKFVAGFVPADWRVVTSDAKRQDEWDGFLDESKVVVIDLARVTP